MGAFQISPLSVAVFNTMIGLTACSVPVREPISSRVGARIFENRDGGSASVSLKIFHIFSSINVSFHPRNPFTREPWVTRWFSASRDEIKHWKSEVYRLLAAEANGLRHRGFSIDFCSFICLLSACCNVVIRPCWSPAETRSRTATRRRGWCSSLRSVAENCPPTPHNTSESSRNAQNPDLWSPPWGNS